MELMLILGIVLTAVGRLQKPNPKRLGGARCGVVFIGLSLSQIHLYAGMSISV